MRGATRRTERGPRGERRLRRPHDELGLTLAAARDLGEHGLVDRRPHLEPLVAPDALATDEVVGRDGDAGDRRERAHVTNSADAASSAPTPPSMLSTAPLT